MLSKIKQLAPSSFTLSTDVIVEQEENKRTWDAFNQAQNDLKRFANKLRIKYRLLIGDEVKQVVEPKEWQQIMLVTVIVFLVFLLILR